MSSPDLPLSQLVPSTTGGPFEDLNAAFVLNSGYLVFFMHCGFAMVISLLSHKLLVALQQV